MDTQRAAAAFCKDSKVAPRLRRLDHAKGVLLARNRQVLGVVAGDLQEYAGIGSALVGLSRRMKKARAKPENCGHLFLVADGVPDGLQGPLTLRIHRDIAKHGKVIAGAEAAKMPLQNRSDIQTAVNCRHVFLVGKKLNT